MIVNAHYGEKTEIAIPGVANPFWTAARKLKYLIKDSDGIYQPSACIKFTDGIIEEINAEANRAVNSCKTKSTQHPDLFNVNAEEERMMADAGKYFDMLANQTVTYTPVTEQPKGEPIDIYEEEPPMTRIEKKIDALFRTIDRMENEINYLKMK